MKFLRGVVLLQCIVFVALLWAIRRSYLANDNSSYCIIDSPVRSDALNDNINDVFNYRTNVPMMYINVESSTARRVRMEKTFGMWGNLTRIEALDFRKRSKVLEAVDTHGKDLEEYFVGAGDSTGVGSGVLLAVTSIAARQAYNDGHKVVLLLQDDVSDILVKYWRWSLDEIVERANAEHPGWYFVQLQATTKRTAVAIFDSWKLDTSSPFFPRQLILPKAYLWGAAAVLVSRDGMKSLIDRVFVGEGGKFDCLPEVERLKHIGVRCHPDNFLWRLEEKSKILAVMPPMFTTVVNEGSTRIRQKKLTTKNKESFVNDNDKTHAKALFNLLRFSILAKASQTFNFDFGVCGRSAAESKMWYMSITKQLKQVLVNGSKLPDFPGPDTADYVRKGYKLQL